MRGPNRTHGARLSGGSSRKPERPGIDARDAMMAGFCERLVKTPFAALIGKSFAIRSGHLPLAGFFHFGSGGGVPGAGGAASGGALAPPMLRAQLPNLAGRK